MTAIYVPSQIQDIAGLGKVVGGFGPIIATRSNPLTSGRTSDGIGRTYKCRHVAPRACAGLRLVYGNHYAGTNGETPNTNSLSVKAAIMKSDGTRYPVWFGGKRLATIEPGAVVTSDPVGVEIAAGDFFFTLQYVLGTDGAFVPVGLATLGGSGGTQEGYAGSDAVDSGSVSNADATCYSPLAIHGLTQPAMVPSVAILGDSLPAGSGDANNGLGFAARALADSLGYVQLAKGTEQTTHFLTTQRKIRVTLAERCTHALCNYGTNDVGANTALATIQANLTDIWNALALRGLKAFHCTLPPRAQSTDSWATLANQSPYHDAARETLRVALNDWIRTKPAPLAGFFDTADAVESSRNSGKWAVNGAANYLTADGLHPTVTGHTLMSLAINTGAFAL